MTRGKRVGFSALFWVREMWWRVDLSCPAVSKRSAAMRIKIRVRICSGRDAGNSDWVRKGFYSRSGVVLSAANSIRMTWLRGAGLCPAGG